MKDSILGRRGLLLSGAAAIAAPALLAPRRSMAQNVDAARRWAEQEFQPSTLSREQQMG